jgi:formylglycine-generating enzyme
MKKSPAPTPISKKHRTLTPSYDHNMKNQLPDHYRHPLPNGLHYPMVRVQPGTFVMGSEGKEAWSNEKPEHLVRITKDYYIGLYPVPQAVWKAVMDGHNPSRFKGDDRPVENVSWLDIVEGGQDEEVPEAFLARLNRLCPAPAMPDLLRDFRFRLPTEAEWEYAAKGGHRTALTAKEIADPPKADARYPLYAGSDKLKEVGWHELNSHGETKAVGLKQPNELGVYDMSGNVFEWCEDWFDTVLQWLRRKTASWGRSPRGSDRVSRGGAGALSRASAALRTAVAGARRSATSLLASAWCSSRSSAAHPTVLMS